jgi:hypothetical protein
LSEVQYCALLVALMPVLTVNVQDLSVIEQHLQQSPVLSARIVLTRLSAVRPLIRSKSASQRGLVLPREKRRINTVRRPPQPAKTARATQASEKATVVQKARPVVEMASASVGSNTS